jgi:hypothetical protein
MDMYSGIKYVNGYGSRKRRDLGAAVLHGVSASHEQREGGTNVLVYQVKDKDDTAP